MNAKGTFTIRKIADLVKQGEGPALEFKRSTGELREAMQTLCAFLNGPGGTVLVGVWPNGTLGGQDVSDQTLHDIAQASDRFEPAAHLAIHRVRLASGKEVVALTVNAGVGKGPFTYEGRAYERVGNTTRKMPQNKYEGQLLDRSHSQHRWENAPADGIAIFDDRVEVWSAGRFPTGITAAMLSREHDSVQRNPIIAEVFHRAGLIEKWGRGTNRVIGMCRAAGIRPPEFAEVGPSAVVTFRVPVAGTAVRTGEVEAPVKAPVSLFATDRTILKALATEECGKGDLLKQLGLAQRSGNFKKAINKLLQAQMIERTIPAKPNSRLQQYRLTAKGKAILEYVK